MSKVWSEVLSKVQLKFGKVQLKFVTGCVRDSGLGLDEFHDPEISGRPRGVMGAHDRGT